jgi:hypothetical protein
MNISINQACTLWDNFRDAMEGKASHGYEAEIYAYTLMPSLPSLNMESINHNADYIRAARSLVDMINLFREKYPDVYVFVDGQDYHFWLEKIQHNFTHRVKVELRSLNGA